MSLAHARCDLIASSHDLSSVPDEKPELSKELEPAQQRPENDDAKTVESVTREQKQDNEHSALRTIVEIGTGTFAATFCALSALGCLGCIYLSTQTTDRDQKTGCFACALYTGVTTIISGYAAKKILEPDRPTSEKIKDVISQNGEYLL